MKGAVSTRRVSTASPRECLAAIARTLGVEVGHFFADLGGEPDLIPSPPQRLLLDLARTFVGLSRQQQKAVCSLARALGKLEPASGPRYRVG